MGIKKFNGETTEEYHQRLIAYASNQIGLISKYEKEKEFDRYRKLNPRVLKLIKQGDEESEKNLLTLIKELGDEIKEYEDDSPEISQRPRVSIKYKHLSSLEK